MVRFWPTWSSVQTYAAGNVVFGPNGRDLYACVTGNINSMPSKTNANWDWIASKLDLTAGQILQVGGQSVPSGTATQVTAGSFSGNSNHNGSGSYDLKAWREGVVSLEAQVHIESGINPGNGSIQVIIKQLHNGVTTTVGFVERPLTLAAFHETLTVQVDPPATNGDPVYTLHVYHTNLTSGGAGNTLTLSSVNPSRLKITETGSYF